MKLSIGSLVIATAIGTVLQVLMVLVGHITVDVRDLYAPGGMGISLLAGILYTVISTEALPVHKITGGLIAGAVCAFIGIVVAVSLGDVAGYMLVIGTIGSAATGALGGWLGTLFASGRV